MKIAITGGTGLVGSALSSELVRNGHEVIILTRKSNEQDSHNPRYVQWLNPADQPENELEGTDAIVNLAGATINDRWTDEYKQRIIDSRIKATTEVNRIIKALENKPPVLINASAVGYYGTSLTEEFTEQANPANDFLADTVRRWEAEAIHANESGTRIVLCRFGVILDKKGGALPKMILPYKLFAGGKVGSGNQWLSWIHIDDVIRGIMFAIENDRLDGPVNFVAPSPVTMDQFGQILSKVLGRPHWLPVPSFALKIAMGDMSMLVLEGQKVVPAKLLTSGFNFKYTDLEKALREILGK
ncbi:TIGR01777 family oxidoreductase [Bacillus sp. ISL-35]|uniref:TIGR01777 family oxidoreductase n=1 Tax=Bacillus sp. ISL-35 TaxID=2819122 RepID=UPI001BE543F4|nr:TIGR01777 family oxidoreductase [Bacillus sp. ISL-35]MBT2681517.1 TIGR01777 family oxidoreductase [Bacillus sp. ISL-35]MBT2705676.1 TIGR01777 family oxidoreductase [Chryseobacterium sp. ISL-80]